MNKNKNKEENKKELALSKIPKQLRIPGLKCFIRIRKNGKKPLSGENWVKDKQIYTFDDPILLEHITDGGNYAFSNTHGFFLVVDADKECVTEKITSSDLPRTLVVQSSELGRNHFIWKCKDSVKGKKELKDKDGPVGDIRGCNGNYYTVCPGSVHPNGKIYKVIIDVPIADVSEKDVWGVLSDFTKKTIKKSKKDKTDSKKIHDGERNNTLFFKACKLRDDKELKKVAIKTLLATNDVQCEPPLERSEVEIILQSAYSYEKYEPPVDFEPISLKELHSVFSKWLFMRNFDFLHAAMAVALSSGNIGTPIWMIFIAPSGDAKSEILRSFAKVKICDQLKYLDEMSDKTLASGAKDKSGKPVKDLGYFLNNKTSLIITKDLATLTAKDKNEKKKIWAKMRELFDGFVQKDTGNGVIRAYNDIHVTWLFGAVPGVRNEVLVHQQLGTRELMFDVESEISDDDAKLDMAWKNENHAVEMRKALENAVAGVLNNIEYNDKIKIPKEMEKFIKEETKTIEMLRASGATDKKNTLINIITPAKPMRAMKQLKRFYIAMKSLDSSFTDEYIHDLIVHIRISCANPVRLKIFQMLKDNPEQWFTIDDFMDELRIGKSEIERQVHALYNIKIANCTSKWELKGAIECTRNDGSKYWSGGRTMQIERFNLRKKRVKQESIYYFYYKRTVREGIIPPRVCV
jgi:hypothetical protein